MKTPKPSNLDEEIKKRPNDSFVAELEKLEDPEPVKEETSRSRPSFLSGRRNLFIIAAIILFILLGGFAVISFALDSGNENPQPPSLPEQPVEPVDPEIPEEPEEPEDPEKPETPVDFEKKYQDQILKLHDGSEIIFAGMNTSEYRLERVDLGIMKVNYTTGESDMKYLAQLALSLKGDDHIGSNATIFSSLNKIGFDPVTGYIYFRTYNYVDESRPLGGSSCAEPFTAEERCPATLQRVHIMDEDSDYEAILEDQDPFDLIPVRTSEGLQFVAYRETFSTPGDYSTRTLSLHRIDLENGVEEDALWEFRVTGDVYGLDPLPSIVTNHDGLISFAYVKGKAPTYLGYVTIETIDLNTGIINVKSMSTQQDVFPQALQVSPSGQHVAIIGSGDGPTALEGPFLIVDVVEKRALTETLFIDNVSLAWTGDKYQYAAINSVPKRIYDPTVPGFSNFGDFKENTVFRLGPSHPSHWIMFSAGDSNSDDGEMYVITPDSTITNKLPPEFNNENHLAVFDWYFLPTIVD